MNKTEEDIDILINTGNTLYNAPSIKRSIEAFVI
ncbi:hypothetical protein [Thermoanaerobacter mathranii]